jgi:hypothetical protein
MAQQGMVNDSLPTRSHKDSDPMKTALFGLAASAAALAVALPAAAETQTLQVAGGSGQRSAQILHFGPVAQSFTAFTDTLTSVGFQFNTLNPGSANAPITFRLFAGETLSGGALYTTSFTLPAAWNDRTARWFDIGLPDVAITNGSVYSLVLSTSSARTGVIVGPDINIYTGQPLGGDAYTGGRAFANRQLYSNCPNTSASYCDLNFRVTGDILAAAVPEASTWALLILGFGVVGGALRASRKTRAQLTFA